MAAVQELPFLREFWNNAIQQYGCDNTGQTNAKKSMGL